MCGCFGLKKKKKTGKSYNGFLFVCLEKSLLKKSPTQPHQLLVSLHFHQSSDIPIDLFSEAHAILRGSFIYIIPITHQNRKRICNYLASPDRRDFEAVWSSKEYSNFINTREI